MSRREGLSLVRLTVNGDVVESEASSLSGLLEELSIDFRTIAVEHNGDVVPKAHYSGIKLADDDRIEIVRFVQGG